MNLVELNLKKGLLLAAKHEGFDHLFSELKALEVDHSRANSFAFLSGSGFTRVYLNNKLVIDYKDPSTFELKCKNTKDDSTFYFIVVMDGTNPRLHDEGGWGRLLSEEELEALDEFLLKPKLMVLH